MPRPIRETISAGALAHNLTVAQRHAAGAKVWAVIKANAYGHGIERAARALAAADGFAVLDFQEAARLRVMGVRTPILMLEGFFTPSDASLLCKYGLTPVIHNPEQVEVLKRGSLESEIDVYLEANSRSAANSAALLRFPEARGDWVRPGIMLYGCSPFADQSAEQLGLRPAMTLTSEIIATQHLQPGERVGYGFSYEAAGEMTIGIVACGYGDGYPRHAPSGTPVLVNGQRARTVGRVSMDMFAVDISDIADAYIGSKVTLWGDGLSADEVGAAAGTLSYELLCKLTARVPVVEVA